MGDASRWRVGAGAELVHRVGRQLAGGIAVTSALCGTGQSDRAMSVLAHEPGRAALRMQPMASCTERRMRNL